MARKNPFANLTDDALPPVGGPALDYTIKGASRSLISSIDEMAARADSLLEGETIVELDPAVVDASFVQDRLDADETDFNDLLKAIRERGQDTPILVRPHPKAVGRYMVVFGHRRLKAAAALGRKVRAVVKDVKDRDHVVAQGQENSARANLSFIERSRFAANLVSLRFDEDNSTTLAALTIDKTTLSKMLSVAALPADVLNAIGAAKNVGRDRWYELKLLLDNPANMEAAQEFLRRADVLAGTSDDRFTGLVLHLKSMKSGKRPKAVAQKRNWAPDDGLLSAEIISDGKRFNLALKARGTEARAFGDYLSENLDRFYEAFRQNAGRATNGD